MARAHKNGNLCKAGNSNRSL